jgi:segregation and condensation protein A
MAKEATVVELRVVSAGDAAGTGDAQRVARVYGQAIVELPRDLYIPPEALEVFLDTFEGPLDLLLYLIRKHNIDILDIPMAEITRQYMEYVDAMRLTQLELAAEYLLMAALLIEIKSRMLLPKPPAAADDEGESDPRAELVRRLMEYERMKLAAQRLDALPLLGRDFLPVHVVTERTVHVPLPDVNAEDLRLAWLGLLSRAKASRHHRVTREQLSVREHMTRVLKRLKETSFSEFGDLFEPALGVPALVVTLLAILELAKENLVALVQQSAFAPIYVRLAHGITVD